MIPNATKKEYIVVNYNDLERFIKKTLGYKDYECIDMEGWSNYSSYEISVNGEISESEEEELENGEFEGMLPNIMNKLCKDGHIEKGEYLIAVSW